MGVHIGIHTPTRIQLHQCITSSSSNSGAILGAGLCRSASEPVCAGRHGRQHVSIRRHKSVQFSGVSLSHVGMELVWQTLLQDALNMVI